MGRSRNRRGSEAKGVSGAYRVKFSWFKQCVYCGEIATEWDHVMPVSVVAGTEFWRASVRDAFKGGLWLVPSCSECNFLAGHHPFTSIRKKRVYIQKKIRKKYQRFLRAIVWEEEEMEEMGHVLRTKILEGMQKMARTELRLSWPASGTRVSSGAMERYTLIRTRAKS